MVVDDEGKVLDVIGTVEEIRVRKPREVKRVIPENLSDERLEEITNFQQDKEWIDGIVSSWRSRNPKHRRNTKLTGTA